MTFQCLSYLDLMLFISILNLGEPTIQEDKVILSPTSDSIVHIWQKTDSDEHGRDWCYSHSEKYQEPLYIG